ncbi:hypothetical protein Tco_1444922, partial [Tanacetum coccineum]
IKVSTVSGQVSTDSIKKSIPSGEEQVEDISPTTLEAAKTLSRVASQKPKSIDKGRRYKRKKETKGKKVVTSLDFQEEVSTGYAKGINTAEGVNTGSIKVSTVSVQVSTDSINKSIPSPDKGQREGKAPMIIEEALKKTKEHILQEEASLAEAIRLDTLEKEEEAKQGTWKLSQVNNLSFVEVKEEFDKLVKQVESFAPINFEATKDSVKRFGEEHPTKTSKRLKSDEAKDDESTKKTGKRKKHIARKGLHSKKTDEDESEASKDADPISGTDIPIHPVPMAIKPSSIATYKIIKQGKEGVYQIVREDGTDIVIAMNRYGMNGQEDELEK